MSSRRLMRRRLAVMTALVGGGFAACTRLGMAKDESRDEPVETAVPISTAPAETPVPPTPVPEPTPIPTPIPSLAVYYDPSYVMAGYSYETTRKARWVADSLAQNPIQRLEMIAPRALEEAEVAAVHDPVYVQAIRTGQPKTLAQSQGFVWDPQLLPAVLSSNGGAVEAALRVMRTAGRVAGSLSSGLHHAHRTYGLGNCTFNGLALATRAALAAGAKNVLILDLDAHCGGGTNELVGNDPRVWHTDIAVHPFDKYTPAPRQTLDVVQAARSYLPTIEQRLDALKDRAPTFDLCLYNAGMDPHERCPVGGLAGVTREVLEARERMVFQWLRERGLPVAFVLAGGYIGNGLDEGGLVGLHRLTLDAAASWL